MAVRLSALRVGRPLSPTPPGRFVVLISVSGWVDPMAIVRLQGLGNLKKIHLIGTRTRDFPACSIVSQPTTRQRSPSLRCVQKELKYVSSCTVSKTYFEAASSSENDVNCYIIRTLLDLASSTRWEPNRHTGDLVENTVFVSVRLLTQSATYSQRHFGQTISF
jgi:hypothetical protein